LKRLHQLFRTRAPALPPIEFIQQLLFKTEKFDQDIGDLPAIPPNVILPNEDVEIVRSAIASRPILVAADQELREAVNGNPILGLRAISPAEALILAEDI
jgi:hypothetical protein